MAKKKVGGAKGKRKRPAVKDLSTGKAAAVRGGLPAVQKVREAGVRSASSLPVEQISMSYSKLEF